MTILRKTSRTVLAFAMLILTLLFLPGRAEAACSASAGSIDFGTISSFAAANAQTASGSSGFQCTGSTLSLLSTNTITGTIASATNSQGTQPRLYNAASGDYIPYNICKDATCSPSYGVGGSIEWSSTTFAGILGLFNSTNGTLPIHIRTTAGANVAAGVYTSTMSFNWQWSLCAIGAFGICVYDTGTASNSVTVTLTVSPDCVLSAPPANFGSAAFVGSFDPVTQTLTVRCTKDSAYTVGISNGQHYSTSRRLSNGTNYIAYEIYYPQGSSVRWGSSSGERRGSHEATTNASVYTGTIAQTYTYRAEILSGQSTPPPGTYTDNLIVDVQF